jgi:hypothetical protein
MKTNIQEEQFMIRKEFFSGVIAVLLFLALVVAPPVQAKSSVKKSDNSKKLSKVQTSNSYRPMDINNIFNYYSNNGDGSFNKFSTSNEGFEFPIGSNDGTAIFEDGLVWTAFKNDTLYAGGSTYNHGLQPGRILQNGTASKLPTADDPDKEEYRVYRVRPDIKPIAGVTNPDDPKAATQLALVANEVAYVGRFETYTAEDIVKQYWKDWTEWPASQGAPFTDANGIAHISGGSGYNAATCTPGFPGSDQTQWMVMNDLNKTLTNNLYGSNPIGIEVQRTIWAYNRTGALGNTIFMSYKFVNKSGVQLDSVYVSQWADPDLGYAGDDAVGCDVSKGLGYVYNGVAVDANYANLSLAPPAVGFDFFQGPIVPGAASDTAIFDLKFFGGKKNLSMTSFDFFINGNSTFQDPPLNSADGTRQWYNLMKGLISTSGAPFPESVTGGGTFSYPGDPVTGIGPTYIGAARVAPPGDVRMCMNAGPFTIAPGDTQQVVVAALAAQGSDYLSSVSFLKYYDDIAQTAYNYLFDLPQAPPAPFVTATGLDGQIVLTWGDPAAASPRTPSEIEHFKSKGYSFQGYNVWQMPANSSSGAKLIATYDLNTSQGIIQDLAFDPITGYIVTKPVQFGTHSGLKRSITITKDAFTNTSIVNNRDYYFAVTAYSYNGTGVEPNNLESPISGYVQDIRAQSTLPGYTATDYGAFSDVTHTGTADASLTVNVMDPYKITGHQYKVDFHPELFALGGNGVWVDVTPPSKKGLSKTSDLTGSSITSSAVYSEDAGKIDIHYVVDVQSPNYDYCDGVQLKLPAGVVIDTVIAPVSNNDGSEIPVTLDRSTNTMIISAINKDSLLSGDSTHRTTNGLFAGGEDIVVRVHSYTLPMVTNYSMYDDNWGDLNGYVGGFLDISGVDSLKTVAKQMVTQNQWNLTDVTTGKIVLKNQTLFSGKDLYNQGDYLKAHGIKGPGGSSGTDAYNVGVFPVLANGMTVEVSGSFDAPTTIGKLYVNGVSVRRSSNEYVSADGNFDMADFTIFGFADGTAAGSLPSYGGTAGAAGATSIDALQQGYELRWTGTLGDTTINGHTVEITKSGGSFATLIGASNYSIKDHPLNPSPGTASPFLIRIPFEVWNIDKNEQVNLLVYDRNAAKLQNPGADDNFKVWNTLDRMYVWCLNTKYDPSTVVGPKDAIIADSATWNWVFFTSTYTTGDVVKLLYNKPLQIGKDSFTFTVPKAQYSSSVAKSDVSKINVFPNPYFGFNKLESDKYTRFVRFTHLPQKANIRIYNLAGILVRTMQKNDASAYFDWDLLNDHQLPVAAGMYIAYIDLPALGKTTTLKLAIIPEQQFLDHY